MFYIGIDIAKNTREASIINEKGELLTESISFTNSQAGCGKLIKLMERFSGTAGNTIIGMEATGHYWLSVYSFLLALGYNLKVINPIQSEAFRKIYIRQTKTDRIDSHVIAQIMTTTSSGGMESPIRAWCWQRLKAWFHKHIYNTCRP